MMKKQMSATTPVIYEDEILPEIEIRELLSMEDMLTNDPQFIAFTRDEIVQYLQDFVADKKKSESIAQVILDHSKAEDDIPDVIVPVLKAERANHSDLDEYEANLEEIKNAPNYRIQQQLQSRLLYPLAYSEREDDEATFVAKKRTLVGIDGGLNELTILLPSDGVEEAYVGAALLVPNATRESYLHEKIVAKLPDVRDCEIFPTNDLRNIRVSFDRVVNLIDTIPDIHGLRVHLARFGYSLDNLTVTQVHTLINHISELPVPQEAEAVRTRSRSKNVATFVPTAFRDFFECLSDLPLAVLDKEKYNMIHTTLASSMPQEQFRQDIPIDIHNIAEGLAANKFTMDDVIGFLRFVRTQYVLQESLDALKRYIAAEPDAIPDNIQAIISKWAQRGDRYTDRTAKTFLDIFKDVAEVKEGNDTSTYDGNPNEQDYQVFEETKYEYVEEVDDDEDPDVAIEPDDGFDVSMLDKYDEGVREVLMPIARKFVRLQKASSVPIDIKMMMEYIAPRVVRVSFKQSLEQHVPDLSVEIRNQLASGTYDASVRVAMSIIPQDLSDRAMFIVRKMHKEFVSLSKSLFIECFAWVVLQTLDSNLEKRLDFDPMNGMLSCIRMWNQFGPPVTKEKDQEGGVLYYLACVAQETQLLDEFKMTYDDAINAVLGVTTTHMAPMVNELKKKFDAYAKENTMTISKAKLANISLAEAIQLKLKKRVLTDYVKALLYIPGMLSIAKHPSNAMGCCMQQLGADFEADSDWQDMKKLKGVKDQFAKKRLAKVPAPHLAWLEKNVNTAEKLAEWVIPKVIDKGHDITTFKQWLSDARDMNLYLLPPDVVDRLQEDPTSLNATITSFVNAFQKTAMKRTNIMETYLSNTHVDKYLLDIVATELFKNISGNEDDVEEQLLRTAVDHVIQAKNALKNLNGTFDHIESIVVSYMIRYMVAKAICLPANPDDTRNGRLNLSDRVGTTFLPNILARTHASVSAFIKSNNMPTPEEQHAFITRMRELQKIETLRVLNSQTEEDRQIMVDAKKLGLFKVDHPRDTGEPEGADADTYEAEGEAEFRYMGEDMEQADDELGL